MSKITNIIFNGKPHYITSVFGSRSPISTKAGITPNMHTGTDYGTNGKKLVQYAIEDGVVEATGTDSTGAKYVKVKYPRIDKIFYQAHLDTVAVKKGQKVEKFTKLGTTGKTGMATGVHMHLSIIDLKTNNYIDPEEYAKEYNEPTDDNSDKIIGKLIVKSGTWYIRKGAGVSFPKVKVVSTGTKLNYYLLKDGWYKVDGGFISQKAVDIYKKKVINYYPKYTGKSNSLVDALKSIDVNSSLNYRKKIALQNNIVNYTGTPTQNLLLLTLLKNGKLIKI